jgi:hypothetical protein
MEAVLNCRACRPLARNAKEMAKSLSQSQLAKLIVLNDNGRETAKILI